jgi:uncharacterized protein (DUF2062 family)
MVIGINPTIGIPTFLLILLAWIFGLNQGASQIGFHAVAPLHFLLFLPFIQVGVHVFHTRKLPLDKQQMEHMSKHPWWMIHSLWQWEWHAIIVWGVVSAIALPLLAMYLRRVLVLAMRRHKALMRSSA